MTRNRANGNEIHLLEKLWGFGAESQIADAALNNNVQYPSAESSISRCYISTSPALAESNLHPQQ